MSCQSSIAGLSQQRQQRGASGGDGWRPHRRELRQLRQRLRCCYFESAQGPLASAGNNGSEGHHLKLLCICGLAV